LSEGFDWAMQHKNRQELFVICRQGQGRSPKTSIGTRIVIDNGRASRQAVFLSEIHVHVGHPKRRMQSSYS
jgi:hypothetical protein